MQWSSILFSLLQLGPVIAIAIKKESYTVRQVAYVWQWVMMVLFLIAMLCAIIAITAFGAAFSFGCTDADNLIKDADGNTAYDNCASGFMIYIYLAWATFLIIGSALQYMWIQVFKAFRDEIEEQPSHTEPLL